MLKVVLSENGSNLCIEKGDVTTDVKLTVYPDEAVLDGDGSVVVSRADLNRAIAFVMGDDLPIPTPDPVPTPTPEPPPPVEPMPVPTSGDTQP